VDRPHEHFRKARKLAKGLTDPCGDALFQFSGGLFRKCEGDNVAGQEFLDLKEMNNATGDDLCLPRPRTGDELKVSAAMLNRAQL
jgi:hypothetical protein